MLQLVSAPMICGGGGGGVFVYVYKLIMCGVYVRARVCVCVCARVCVCTRARAVGGRQTYSRRKCSCFVLSRFSVIVHFMQTCSVVCYQNRASMSVMDKSCG